VLRLGGATADRSAAGTVTQADLAALAVLVRRTGWRVLLTADLGHYDPAAAAQEVATAHADLGQALIGVSIGNEPDRFVADGLRPVGYRFDDYVREVRAYRAAIDRIWPRAPLAGPGVSSYPPNLDWVPAFASAVHPALLSAHYYPLSACGPPAPTAVDLLSASRLRAQAALLARMAAIARGAHTPLRIDETNDVACRGEPGVSDTFAAALWAAGFIGQAMSAQLDGVNLHDLPAEPTGYAPLAAASPAALAAGQLTAEPQWYALRLARPLVGERPLPVRVRPGGLDVGVTAALTAGGRVRVLIVDDEAPGAEPLRVRIPLETARSSPVSLVRLSAPSPEATTGVMLTAGPVAGTTVTVPASSAALLTLVPRR
jgi:hypothetical protein